MISSGRHRNRLEHHVVWERKHHRKLDSTIYVIHHINGKPWWNEPDNLKRHRKSVHDRISNARRGKGHRKLTAYDLKPEDYRYLTDRGVSIPQTIRLPILKGTTCATYSTIPKSPSP